MQEVLKRLWISHRVLTLVAGGLAGLVCGLALLHTSLVRSRVLAWAVERLRADAGIQAEVERLDYNLLTLRLSVHRATLAVPGADPFFSVEAIRLDLPWSVLRGRVAIESLEIDRPRLVVTRNGDGALNLPSLTSAREPTTAPRSSPGLLDIGRLVVRGLSVSYDDAPAGVSIDGRDLSLNMSGNGTAPLSGRLTMSGGVTLRAANRQTALSRLEGGLAFDGSALRLDRLTVAAPEGEVSLDGQVDLFAAAPHIEMGYEGGISLASAAPWIVPNRPMRGDLTFSGTASGEVDAPHVSLALSGRDLAWGDEGNLSLDLRASMSSAAVVIEALNLTVAGGEASGSARVEFGDRGSSRAQVQWKMLDVGALARALDPDRPLRFGAVADGETTVAWTGSDLTTATGRADVRLTARHSGPPALPLAGRLLATLDAGQWRIDLRPLLVGAARIAGRVNGTFDASELPATPFAGRLDVDTGELGDLLPRIRQSGVEVPPFLDDAVTGRITASAALGGTLGLPRASGTLEGHALTIAQVGPGSLRARFSADPGSIALNAIGFEVGPNVLAGEVAADLAAGTLRATVTAELARLSTFTAALPAQWRPDGAARLEATVSGAFDNPSVRAVLSTKRIDIAGQTVGPVDAVVRLADHLVVVERFELTQDEGRLSLTGRYALDSGRYALEGTGRRLVVRPIGATSAGPDTAPEAESEGAAIPIEARFDLGVSAEGTIDAPTGRAFINVTDVAWGSYDLGSARVDFQVEKGEARLAASVPALQATITAAAGLGSRQFTAEATISSADLTTVLRAGGPVGEAATAGALPAPPPFSGAMTAHATALGCLDDLAGATADLDLGLIDAIVGGTPIRLDRAAHLRYDGGAIVADNVALSIGGTVLSAEGRFGAPVTDGEALAVALRGSLGDLVPLIRLVPELDRAEAAGRVELAVRVAGVLAEPEITGMLALSGGAFGTGDLPAAEGIVVDAAFEKGLLTLRDLRAAWQGATLSASGTAPASLLGTRLPDGYRRTLPPLPDRARLSVTVDSVTPAALSPFLDAETVGQLKGALAMSAAVEVMSLDVGSISADVTFGHAELTVAGVPLSQVRPTRLRLADGRLDVVDWTWSGAGNELSVRGSLYLDKEGPRLDAVLDGALDLRMLGAFLPDVATRGRATFLVQATGPARGPDIDGEIMLRQGEIAIRDPRIAVTGLTGTIAMTSDRLELVDVRGGMNGGTLRLTGEVQYQGLRLAGGSIELIGRGIALEVPAGLRSEVDLDLALAVSEAPALTGHVTVLRGSYREPISLAGQLLSQVEVRPIAPPASGPLDRIRLSVSVLSAERILVDNNYGRLEIESGLKVTGTLAQPALAGRLTIGEGGVVFLAGQSWRVERGTTDFISATGIEPTFDLALVTRVQRYDVRLSVRGTPDALEANLTSPDGLSQADAVSLLLTGQLADERTAAQADIARGQLVMLLSGELLGFAGRVIGFDSAQVSRGLGVAASDFDLMATDIDPGARLTVSKRLRRDVEVIFSQSLSESADLTWIAIYRPQRAIELRATTGANSARSYEFRSGLSFGGGGPRARQAAGDRRVEPRVSAIRFSGTRDLDERLLRSRLRLGAGSRFDFYRWQEDRDRLTALYHERGYLEAHVDATREPEPMPSGEPGVVLKYAIDRGPATTLVVEGTALPGGIVEQMRHAWTRAVFDGFLIEDLEVMARRALVEQGYLQARATAVVRDGADANEKIIVVTLTPGPRFAERRLVFQGQESLSADQLDQIVRSTGLGLTAWLQPARVETALARHYRALGYLSATVSLEAPHFSGGSASRVVRISEGRRSQVVAVDIVGARVTSEADVRRLFGIDVSSPYDPSALEPARRAVELAYLRDGYNDIRVSVVSLADEEQARIDLTLTVDEGRQQVLEEVSVAGAAATTGRTIERALDLEIGQPVDLSDTYRAQKRLYDTGVFQRADIELVPIGGDGTEGEQPVRAAVTLEEVPWYRFRYGVRVGDEAGPTEVGREIKPGLVADLLRRNLFGAAVTTGLAGQVETDRRLVRGILSIPRFFDLPVTSSLYLTRSRQDLTAGEQDPVFVEDTSDLTFEQRFRVRSSMAFSYNYRFTRLHLFQTTEPGPGLPALDSLFDVARLSGAFAWDTRDDPFDARRGWFHSSGVEYAAAALGSDLRFVKYVLQQYYFRPVAGRVVLASAFRLGAARGFDQDLIPSERFFAGGAGSVRGFGEDALGGVNFFGDPVGGSSLLIVNQEVRFPIYRWVRGVGFFDAGNVFSRIRDLNLFDLEVGAGGGLRIETPFGLARIDFGVPLSRRSQEPFGRWYFSIGQAF